MTHRPTPRLNSLRSGMPTAPAIAVEEQDTIPDVPGLGRINGEAPGVGRPEVEVGDTRRGSEGGRCPDTVQVRKLALTILTRAGGLCARRAANDAGSALST